VRLLIGLLFRLPKWGQTSWLKPGIGNHEVTSKTDLFSSYRTSSIYSFCVQSAVHSFKNELALEQTVMRNISLYEACPESKDAKVLNVYNIFNLQKRQCE